MNKIFLLSCLILQTFNWSYGSEKRGLTIKNPMHMNPKDVVAIIGVRLIESNGDKKIITEDLLKKTNKGICEYDYIYVEKNLRDGSWYLYHVNNGRIYLDSSYDKDTKTLNYHNFHKQPIDKQQG